MQWNMNILTEASSSSVVDYFFRTKNQKDFTCYVAYFQKDYLSLTI